MGTLRGTGVSTPGLPWSPALGPSCPVPWFLFSLTWDCREAETRSCQTGWTSRPGRDVLVCMVCMIYCFHVLNLNLSFMHFCFKVLSSPCDLKRESWYRCLSPTRGARFCISESCISLRGVPRSLWLWTWQCSTPSLCPQWGCLVTDCLCLVDDINIHVDYSW